MCWKVDQLLASSPLDLSIGTRARRAWEALNQNQLDYPTISRRIWKESAKKRSSNFNSWQPLSNEKQPSQGGSVPAKSGRRPAPFRGRASLAALYYASLRLARLALLSVSGCAENRVPRFWWGSEGGCGSSDLACRTRPRIGLRWADLPHQHRRRTGAARICVGAQVLGEDEDWLHELPVDMLPENGCMHVYRGKDDAVTAFTDYEIDRPPSQLLTSRPIISVIYEH